MQRFKKIGIFLIILVFSASCSRDKLVEVEMSCPPEDVTYAEHIRPIINETCAYSGCHDGGGNAPGDYNTFAGVSVHIDNGLFESRTVTLRDMPPSYVDEGFADNLTEEQLELVTCWIANGYIEE